MNRNAVLEHRYLNKEIIMVTEEKLILLKVWR